jgi:hypothetical protein
MSLNDNYRRDLLKRINELTLYRDIDGVTEKTSDPKVLNTRFRNLTQSMHSIFEAMADIASRDKKYLQTFFQGFVNPVYQKGYSYNLKSGYLTHQYFQSNGVPVSFASDDPRIYFDAGDYGDFKFNDVYEMVYRNGILMDQSQYDLYNTAYGLKLYIKDAFVSNNDQIDLTINKKFNPSITGWNYLFTSSVSSFTTSFPVNDANTGQLYHQKHLLLYVKTAGSPFFTKVDPNLYEFVMDMSGTVINLAVEKAFGNNDRLLALNSTMYWEKRFPTISGTTDCCTLPGSALVTSDNLPVPFISEWDFDIYLDGRKLIPLTHFRISRSIDCGSYDEVIFLFDIDPLVSKDIIIIKNEPAYPEDMVLIKRDNLNVKGLEQYDPNAKFPIMPQLGTTFINGRFFNNTHQSAPHRSLLEISDVPVTNYFLYTMKVVTSSETDSILTELQALPSEMDLVVEYLGLSSVIANLYADLPDLTLVTEDNLDTVIGVTDWSPNAAWWRMVYFYVQIVTTSSGGELVYIDASGSLPQELDVFSADQILDANQCTCAADIVIDANTNY